MNIIKCAKFNVMLTHDFIIRIKNRFKTSRTMQEPNRQNQLKKKFSIAYFHLFAIFTLKLAGKYSSKRWKIIYAALRITKKGSNFLDLALVKVWIVLQPRLRFVFHQVTTPKWYWHLQIKRWRKTGDTKLTRNRYDVENSPWIWVQLQTDRSALLLSFPHHSRS